MDGNGDVDVKVFADTSTAASAAMVAHRLLSSKMRSIDDNDWPVCTFLDVIPTRFTP